MAWMDEDRTELITIKDISGPAGEPEKRYRTEYTFFDMNGDGIAECHVKSDRYYLIFTVSEGEMYLWRWEDPESELLNNGDLLYRHEGGVKTCITYFYEKLDTPDTCILYKVAPDASQYDAVRYYSEGYAAVQKDGKWGFVDEAGQCVIPCQYDEVEDFSEGLAAVKDADHNGKGEQWAYIDTKGEIQIDFYPYEATEGRRVLAGQFHDGIAFVSKGLYCIMDTKGEMIFSGDSRFFISVTEYNKEYDAIPGYVYIDDRMTIRKYGLMGLHGEERMEPVFDYVYGTREPYVIVALNIGGEPRMGVIKLETTEADAAPATSSGTLPD